MRYRVAAAVEHASIIRQLNDLRTVVDIGANRGQFALAVRGGHPSARLLSFEPLPLPASVYRRVFAHDPLATLHEAAVGRERRYVDMHVSARDDSSSLLPMSAVQGEIFPGTHEVGRTEVCIGRLEDYVNEEEIESPALLKLDVQGAELMALTGCERLLHLFNWVYVECSFMELYVDQPLAGEVIAWLRQRGIVLSGVYNVSFDSLGRAVQADFLFSREAIA